MDNKIGLIFLLTVLVATRPAQAQVSVWQESRRGSIYVSLGNNIYSEPTSTVHVYQQLLNNSYDLVNAKGSSSSTGGGPNVANNLNLNVGYFFNYNQTWAIEAVYNPFSYYIADNQHLTLKGAYNGVQVDTNIVYSSQSGSHYFINNGSTLLQFNLVRRVPVYRNKIRRISVDLYGKAGVGPVFVHADNATYQAGSTSVFSTSAGWDADVSAGVKITVLRHYFVEVLKKYTLVKLTGVPMYEGVATQQFALNSINVNLGVFLPTTKFNPLFRKGFKRPRGLPNGPEPRGDLTPEGADPMQQVENY